MIADGGTDKSLEKNIVLATKKGSAVLDKWLPDDIKSYYHVLHIVSKLFYVICCWSVTNFSKKQLNIKKKPYLKHYMKF
jgi:hypothetical protein